MKKKDLKIKCNKINIQLFASDDCYPEESQICYPDCNPDCNPNCSPNCNPNCNPNCDPRCTPVCGPSCNPCYPSNHCNPQLFY